MNSFRLRLAVHIWHSFLKFCGTSLSKLGGTCRLAERRRCFQKQNSTAPVRSHFGSSTLAKLPFRLSELNLPEMAWNHADTSLSSDAFYWDNHGEQDNHGEHPWCDDHVMPVGLPNMYTHIKIRSRQCDENVEGPGELLIGRRHI